MPSINFVDYSNATPITAAWLNDVNRTQYTILGNPADRAGYIALDTAHAGGTADAITATFGVALSSVPDGVIFYVRAAAANATATPTFTPNSGVIVPATIIKGTSSPLSVGDILGAGYWMLLQYDATASKWVLLNPASGTTSPLLNSRNPQGAAYTVAVTDMGRLIDATTGTWALSMDPATLGANFAFAVRNSGSGLITLTPSAGTIDGASTVTLSANASCMVFCDGTNFETVGRAATQISMVRLNTDNGYGSTNTAIRRFLNVVVNQGPDITYTDSATLGASFTINVSGVYAMSFNGSFNAAGNIGLSLNSTQLTTNIISINVNDRLAASDSAAANGMGLCAWTGYLPAGSIVRPHTGGAPSGSEVSQFTIARVS